MGVLTLYLVKYTNEQKAGMVAGPEGRDRVAAHRKAIADFGGKPIAAFGSYGEYDMVYIYEMPDHKALAANLHLVDTYNLAKYCKANPADGRRGFRRIAAPGRRDSDNLRPRSSKNKPDLIVAATLPDFPSDADV